MANYIATDTALIATASAIRSKRDITSSIMFNATKGFADAVTAIDTRTDVTNTTATAADVFNDKYFYTSDGVRTQGAFSSGVVLAAQDYTSIPASQYARNQSIRYAGFPNCTTIGMRAFYNCQVLTSVSFPACTTIGEGAFQNCLKLISVNFPACTTIGTMAFFGCSHLTSAIFPACTTIGMRAFYDCKVLTSVSSPACTKIIDQAFYNCIFLSVIYLAKNSVATLTNSDAFNGTKITFSTGSIIVPSNLVNSYKMANNWSYFSDRIFAI